jgi:hypothetical protein
MFFVSDKVDGPARMLTRKEAVMAIQIDDDWKKQAQEEKRRMAEEAKAREEAAASKAASASTSASEKRSREMPPASFNALISTMLTQAGYYLGEYAGQDGEPMVDLDAAKFQIDLLGVIEEKTKNNVTVDEQKVLDAALYDLRTRYVSIATQMIR